MDKYGFTTNTRVLLIVGAVIFLGLILLLLKRGKLNVQYSIIWLLAGGALVLFAVAPVILLHIRNITGIEVVSNLVFLLLFVFVLFLLLSLSTIVSGFAVRIKQLTQTQALLEKRVRELEAQMGETAAPEPQGSKKDTTAQG